MSKVTGEKAPRFTQLVTCTSEDEDGNATESLYALDGEGRVWQFLGEGWCKLSDDVLTEE